MIFSKLVENNKKFQFINFSFQLWEVLDYDFVLEKMMKIESEC